MVGNCLLVVLCYNDATSETYFFQVLVSVSEAYFNLCIICAQCCAGKVHCSSITDTAFVIAHDVLCMVDGGGVWR